MVGSRAASIDLPAPGGPTISRLWPPAAATSRARFALSCPLMSLRSMSASEFADLGLWTGEHLRAAEMIGELDQRCSRDDLHFRACPGGLRAASGGTDEAFAAGIGADRGGEQPRGRGGRAAPAGGRRGARPAVVGGLGGAPG